MMEMPEDLTQGGLENATPLDRQGTDDSGSVYLSISDVMSGLLLAFVLVVVVFMVRLREREDVLRNQQDQINDLQERLEVMMSERRVLIGQLVDAFSARNIDVEVNPETGDVSIRDDVLFDLDESRLRPEAADFLDEFVPAYSQVIFSRQSFDEQITRIVIEGHTSSRGTHVYNMRLSLMRAMSVWRYVFVEGPEFPTRGRFRRKVILGGRGEEDAEQSDDRTEDRRVLFRFQFRGDEILAMFDELRRAAGVGRPSLSRTPSSATEGVTTPTDAGTP